MPPHMATPPVFFLLFYLLLLVSLTLIYPADSKCERSFQCGNLGSLEFPFAELGNRECGVFFVNCASTPPTIHLGSEGYPLHVRNRTGNKLRVEDPHLRDMLKPQGKCDPVGLGSPYTTSSEALLLNSFVTYHNITLLSCAKELKPGHCKCYHGCGAFDLCYRDESDIHGPLTAGSDDIPHNCSIVHMPRKGYPSPRSDGHDLLQYLAPIYELEWQVSAACNYCEQRGDICPFNTTIKQVYCQGKREWKPATLVAVICAGAAFLGLCFLVSFLIRCRKNKSNRTYLLSRSISSGPPSTSDLELGGGRFFFGIPVFSYQELQEATNNFDSSKRLGDGGFGTVYYGKLQDGREVAIKRLYEHNCRRVEQFLNEIKILARLRHPNLVTLHGCTSRRSRELLLVYEYIPNGTVADHLHGEMADTSPLTWPVRMSIAIETASALAYLHKSDIIHRDVKTYNILLDNNFCVKVADFGLSRLFPNDVSHISTAPQGTPGYVDPEYHQCYQLTDKSDVYSFGVVLIELISSLLPVDITRHRHEINLANLAVDRIQRCAFDELIDSSLGHQTDAEVERMTTSVAELAFRCLQLEKDLRPSMDEVLEFLKDIKAGENSNL